MAKSRALTKIQGMEKRRAAAASRARALAKAAAQSQQHTLIAGVSAFGLGFAENKGMRLPTIDAIDPTALYTVVSFAASMMIQDKQLKRILEGVTDGLISLTAYKAGSKGFNSLFNYSSGVSGYGEEIVETGEF